MRLVYFGVLEYTFGSCSYSICPSSRMMKVGSRNRTPTFQGGAMFQPGGSDQVVPCIPPPASRALKTPKSNPVGLKSYSFVLSEQMLVYAVGGMQQEKLCKPCEQCQDEPRSRYKAGYHQTASAYAFSRRGSSGRPPRKARTEHEHHLVGLHRCCSP